MNWVGYMPLIKQVELKTKIIDLHLQGDGTFSITLSVYIEDGNKTTVIDTQSVDLSAVEADAIFGANGNAALTRRDDIARAVYEYLLTKKIVEGELA